MGTIELRAGEKLQLIEIEMRQLEAELYRTSLKIRVQKRIGNEGRIEEFEKSMEDLEAGLDEMQKAIEEVKAEQKKRGKDDEPV